MFRLDSDASALDGIINATGPGGERFGLLWVGGNNFQGEAYDSTQRFAIDASVVAGAGNWHHVIVRYDQTNLSTWVDDMDDAAATSIAMTGAQAAAVLTAVLNIGNHPSAVFKGYIAEVIIFPTALDQTTRRGITMYLKGRYPSMALNDTTTAVSFGATTASYSTSAKAFTLAGGSTVFQLLCATGVPAEDRIASCFLDLGFTLTDKTGALNYTAVNQSYQSRHFLKAELAAAASITAGAVLDHNAGAGGTFTLEGNSIDLFLVPPVSQALSGDATLRIAFFNATSQRIWRLVINDVSNIAGYAEVGKWSVSPYVQATYCHSQDFSKTLEELSPIGYGTHGSHFADERTAALGVDAHMAGHAGCRPDALRDARADLEGGADVLRGLGSSLHPHRHVLRVPAGPCLVVHDRPYPAVEHPREPRGGAGLRCRACPWSRRTSATVRLAYETTCGPWTI